jgi:hypothetical protein
MLSIIKLHLEAKKKAKLSSYQTNRITDGGEVVSPTHRLRSTPQKHYFSVSGTNFC